MTSIQLIKNYGPYTAGQIISVTEATATKLAQAGIASTSKIATIKTNNDTQSYKITKAF